MSSAININNVKTTHKWQKSWRRLNGSYNEATPQVGGSPYGSSPVTVIDKPAEPQ